MKRITKKIIYALTTAALITAAFVFGKSQSETVIETRVTYPDKYSYLNLESVTETQIENGEVVIYTDTGDYYTFDLD